MMLTIGIAVYGIAHLLRGRPARGLLYTILGLAGTALVRPHMSVLVVIAATLAYALRKAPPSANPIAPVARAVMLVLLIAASVVFVMRAATFFHVASLDSTEITGVLSATQSRSLEGHSTFNAKPVHNPLDLVRAVITVLFRPFPTEAHSAQMLLSSAESSTLLLLVVLRWRRVVAAFRHFRRWPFVAFAALYTIGFCAAFAAISNFGILARQRILVLPALFAILAVPVVTREAEHLAVPEEPQRVG